jgi:15-cis-phytoene synthase
MDLDYTLNQVSSLPEAQATAGIANAADYVACREIMLQASKNYSTASKYLPAEKLPHVEALYALLRVGDDRVDVSHSGFSSPLEAIDDWEATYWRAFSRGSSPNPVMRAYLDTAIRFGIPSETMVAYFQAMREDLSITRFPTFNHLLHYVDGSAIPVGRAMTYILGVACERTGPCYTFEDALHGADCLSIAMQLSNFWRDIGYDWSIGRVYIPQEDLERFGYRESDLKAGNINQNFIDLLEFEFERTEGYYDIARQSVKMLDSGRWAVMSALEIYRGILASIRRNDYNVFTRRAGPGYARKFGLALKSYWNIRKS